MGFAERPGDYRVSKTLVDTLQALDDPRLPFYAAPAESDGEYRGMPNGMPDQHDILFGSVSKMGDWHLRANAPAYFLSYPEVLLSQAEAAERGWIGGDPGSFYTEAIAASMLAYGIPASEIEAYLSQPRVTYAGGQNGLEQIALQKWLVLYDEGVEAFTEWRRTGVPNLAPSVANENSGRMPLRLPYPISESAVKRAEPKCGDPAPGGRHHQRSTMVGRPLKSNPILRGEAT